MVLLKHLLGLVRSGVGFVFQLSAIRAQQLSVG